MMTYSGGSKVGNTEMRKLVMDGQNMSYAYGEETTGVRKFSYEAYIDVMKSVTQVYGFSAIITMPKFRLDELHKKNRNERVSELIEQMVENRLIHITRNERGADDREAVQLAMRLGGKLLSNDARMSEHLDKFSKEDKIIADEWLNNNRIEYFFSAGVLVLMGCVPDSTKIC